MTEQRWNIFFLIIFCLFLFSFVYAVFTTAIESMNYHDDSMRRIEFRHRAAECEQYYNNGTDEWKDCMGVGYQ